MGKTIRASINHSTRNHTVNRARTHNRRQTGVDGDEFKRGKRYMRHDYSWNPEPHNRRFNPKDVVEAHVVSARKRRDQTRLRHDHYHLLGDTLIEDVLAKQHANDAGVKLYCAAQKKTPLSRSYGRVCDERTLINHVLTIGCNV